MRDRYKSAVPCLTLVALSFACYMPFLGAPFEADDLAIIAENPAIRRPENALRFLSTRYWRELHPGTKGLYRPLREMLFTLLYAAAGRSSAAFRLLNVALHAGTVLALYGFGRGLFGRARTAFLGALFFAVHPIHSEPVIWVKNAGDLLCGLFTCLSAFFFIRNDGCSDGQPTRGRGVLQLLFSALCFGLALLSKETAIGLPLLLLVYSIFRRERSLREGVRRTAILWVVALLYLGVVIAPLFIGKGPVFGAARTIRVSMPLRFAMFTKTFARYHLLLLFPVSLNAIHQFDHPRSLLEPGLLAEMTLGVLLMAGVVVLFKFWRDGRISVIWPVIFLGPALNLIPYSGRALGENRLYLPSVGLCLSLAQVLEAIWSERGRWATTFVGALIGIFATLLIFRGAVWESPRTFWSDVLRKSPGWPDAYGALGKLYWDGGERERGIIFFQKAVALCDAGLPPGTRAEYHFLLSMACAESGDPEEARRHAAAVAKLAPGRTDMLLTLAGALGDREALGKLISRLESEVKKRPEWDWGWLLLARGKMGVQDLSGAAEAVEHALAANPRSVEAIKLMVECFLRMGRYESALHWQEKLVNLIPNDPEARLMLDRIRAEVSRGVRILP